MKKFPVGQSVMVNIGSDKEPDYRLATVVHHGYDSGGIYTEVMYEDGTTEKVHRERLTRA